MRWCLRSPSPSWSGLVLDTTPPGKLHISTPLKLCVPSNGLNLANSKVGSSRADSYHRQSMGVLGVVDGGMPGISFLGVIINDHVDHLGDPAGNQPRTLFGLRLF